jgi:hypothetical protein
VRSTIGRSLSGWSGIGDWEGRGQASLNPYLCDDNACLIDESSRDRKHLTIPEGITRLRNALRTPRQCIRLIGLSGVGKTRFVQALFEPNVGNDPLDPSLAIYTDYSTETTPIARDMARDLIARRQRATLVVDNCNPNTHSELARICGSDDSEVSLITVEYDVRDDEPERTDVFRLDSASRELVAEWIKQSFSHVSQVDRERIAEFSDGNFRVAGALAQTLCKGETLGSLKNRDLLVCAVVAMCTNQLRCGLTLLLSVSVPLSSVASCSCCSLWARLSAQQVQSCRKRCATCRSSDFPAIPEARRNPLNP